MSLWQGETPVFSAAEAAASEAVDQILKDSAHVLHAHYLAKKATPFAADAISNCILANIAMCFVRHEKQDDAVIDEEAPEEIPDTEMDYWGRMSRPHMDGDQV